MPLHYTPEQFAIHAQHPSFLTYETVRSNNFIRVFCTHDLALLSNFQCPCHWGQYVPDPQLPTLEQTLCLPTSTF
jgi:hypothetical protein